MTKIGQNKRDLGRLKFTYGSVDAEKSVSFLSELVRQSSIPDPELSRNLGIFMSPACIGRLLFLDHIYKKIINIQGVIADFGCRYGQNISIFSGLREIYEPYNRLRKIYGFDSFVGFPETDKNDGANLSQGDYSVPPFYKEELARTLECLRGFSSIPHLEITDLHEGDVIKTLPRLLNRYPSTMFALCYFDLDIYKPTKVCLEHVYKRMPKGGVIAFDELNDQDVPGETVAFFEVLGDENITVRRFPPSARTSYIVKGT